MHSLHLLFSPTKKNSLECKAKKWHFGLKTLGFFVSQTVQNSFLLHLDKSLEFRIDIPSNHETGVLLAG